MSPRSKVHNMATYPSGLTRPLPEPDDSDSWARLLDLAIDDQPLGTTAPCLNPECDQPVEYDLDAHGPGPLYCSHYCRSRTFDIRSRVTQQLQVIETALGDKHRYARGIPRAELRDRQRRLKWWHARLSTER